jgi:alginate O-acetyltransferase complex protein AlgI
MLFTSTVFLFLFLPGLLAVYFAARSTTQRNLVLLLASLFFYAWGEQTFVLLLLGSIGLNHLFARWIASGAAGRPGRVLALGLAANLALLGGFKYGNFAIDNLNRLTAAFGLPALEVGPIHLPLGISFFTFQAMSFLVDLRRGGIPERPGLLHTALYISLFPQLIAGPIVRYRMIALQLRRRAVTRAAFASGLQRFTIGFAKKTLIADGLAIPGDAIFSLPAAEVSFGMAWLGAICFTLQIYFDFSGYTDMAVGLGRLFGFGLPENFRHPYVATSIRDFWRRWHITLSTWFRDYLYVPLGGSRREPRRVAFNLLVVFLLCGLWHGASWNFVVWGLLHGAFLALERTAFGRALAAMPRPLRHAYVLAVVVIAWVPFRAGSLPEALHYLAAMFGLGAGGFAPGPVAYYLDGATALWLVVGVIASTPLCTAVGRRIDAAEDTASGRVGWPAWAVPAALAALLVAGVATVAAGTQNPFVYFRF